MVPVQYVEYKGRKKLSQKSSFKSFSCSMTSWVAHFSLILRLWVEFVGSAMTIIADGLSIDLSLGTNGRGLSPFAANTPVERRFLATSRSIRPMGSSYA